MKKSIKKTFINPGRALVLVVWAIIGVYQLSINILYLPLVIASAIILRFFLF